MTTATSSWWTAGTGPGGHWNDAYPFVRLRQPAACYDVNARPLSNDQLDEHGLNAGLYQQADGVQVCDYFRRVMDDHKASGQVRFCPMSNYLGLEASDVAVVATLTGATTQVKVRMGGRVKVWIPERIDEQEARLLAERLIEFCGSPNTTTVLW